MALDPTTPFVWGAGGAPMTPQAAEAQRKVARALLMQGADYSPIKSPWQGAARVAQALVGGYESAQADASDRKLAEMQPQMLAAALTAADPGAAAQPIASGTAPPMGSTSIPSGEIDPRLSSAISTAASSSGVDPAYMTRLAMVENGGKVEGGSQLSSAQGPFQFLSDTAKQYGLSNPSDPAASADAAARLTLDNKAALTNALGREPTPGELYLAHQQGAGGAIKLLQNPNAPVESVIGAQAARNNAATPGMTAGQFANKWMGKFGDIVQTADPNQKNIIDAQADSPAPMAFAGTQAGAGAPTSALAPIAPAAVPAAPQPASSASMAKIAPLISLASSPYASPATKQIAGVLLSSQLSAIQKANDPLRALDMQTKQLAIRKAQQDLNKSDFEWEPIGRDANGEWAYGFVNSKTGEVRDRFNQPIQQQQQSVDDPTAGLAGEDYLKAIPRDRADLARKVANGEIDVASLPNRGNYRMQVLSDAARFDPTFNPSDYKTRLATRKDFTSGKSAQNITSFNTAIGHLDTLDKAIDPLGNSSSSLYNKITAPISEQTDPKYQVALKNFRTAKQAVADELSRAFKGAGGTVHDISEWEKTINAADSPAALHAAVKQAVELLHSRINAIGDQYNRGMGKTTDPASLLSPKAKATLERLEGGATDQPAASGPVTINGYKIEAVD